MSEGLPLTEIPIPERRIAFCFFITALIGAELILPQFFLRSSNSGPIALAFLGICICITGIILGFQYWLKGQKIVSLVNTEVPLIIWRDDPASGKESLKKIYIMTRKEKNETSKQGSYMLLFFTFIGVMVFVFIDKIKPGIWFLGLMLFLIALVYLTGFLLAYMPYRRGLEGNGLTVITRKYLYYNQKFYLFNGFNSKLTHIGYRDRDQKILEFAFLRHTYQAGNNIDSVLIPITEDKEEDVIRILGELKSIAVHSKPRHNSRAKKSS